MNQVRPCQWISSRRQRRHRRRHTQNRDLLDREEKVQWRNKAARTVRGVETLVLKLPLGRSRHLLHSLSRQGRRSSPTYCSTTAMRKVARYVRATLKHDNKYADLHADTCFMRPVGSCITPGRQGQLAPTAAEDPPLWLRGRMWTPLATRRLSMVLLCPTRSEPMLSSTASVEAQPLPAR